MALPPSFVFDTSLDGLKHPFKVGMFASLCPAMVYCIIHSRDFFCFKIIEIRPRLGVVDCWRLDIKDSYTPRSYRLHDATRLDEEDLIDIRRLF